MPDYMVLIFAYSLDLAIGDPAWLPHPVRIIGRAIGKAESSLRFLLKLYAKKIQRLSERIGGILLVIIIAGSTYLVMFLADKGLQTLIGSENTILRIIGAVLLVYLISTTLATKELTDSARKIIAPLRGGDIIEAREKLSCIVGRDTGSLDDKGIFRATIESLAENASDGIIAPLFYFVIGGLPLAMTYKAVNTMDSMVGYKDDRYRYFGWAAARLDDLANYIPARLTGLLIVISSSIVCRSLYTFRYSLKTMLRDGRRHSSPNSGIPEAALAGALNVRLGGPSSYNGILVDKPFIGDNGCSDYLSASGKAINIIKIASLSGFSISTGVLFMRSVQ